MLKKAEERIRESEGILKSIKDDPSIGKLEVEEGLFEEEQP
jgi:hypothetical protein